MIENFFSISPEERSNPKRPVLLLRWLVIIATSYMVLFSGEAARSLETGALLTTFILSNLILGLFPSAWFLRNALLTAVVLFDSSMVSGALLLTPGIEGDIFILYFFVILLAAAGGSFWGILVAGLAVPGLYLMTLGAAMGSERVLQTDVLLRVPFIFCVCIFYGFLSERARRDRLRAESAELSEHTKTQLFSTLTHDVKNGLGTIIGFSEILLDGDPEISVRVRETLQQIKMTSLHNAQLISNLLDAARIEGGQMRIVPRRMQIGEVLLRVAERYEAQASLKKIRLDVVVPPDLPAIDGDDLQLDRVFANLVSNALKFTPEGGQVSVRAASESGAARVDIEDDGPGVSPAERDRIFQMYQQTDGGRQAGGVGLGLFVVRTLLEAHGAQVTVDSADSRGARFRVTFPRASAASG